MLGSHFILGLGRCFAGGCLLELEATQTMYHWAWLDLAPRVFCSLQTDLQFGLYILTSCHLESPIFLYEMFQLFNIGN